MADDRIISRLLALLGVAARPPSLEALRELQRAWVLAIPFENVSKLLRLDGPAGDGLPSLEQFVESAARLGLGGTCYTCNPYLTELLLHLGYEATLQGADMGEQRNVHTCVRVVLGGTRYHLDVGYGGRFLEPVNLDDGLPAEIRLGNRSWVFAVQGEPRRLQMTLREDGAMLQGYSVNPGPIDRTDLRRVVDQSYRPGAEFMRRLTIIRQFEDRMVSLNNRDLVTRTASETITRHCNEFAEVERSVREDLAMPGVRLRRAAEIVEARTGVRLLD